jgi:hypothetical protein
MIFQPTYFSPIYQFQALAQADEAIFEVFDNYQKQSYRNRLKIYSANGILTLSIPIKHNNGKRQLTRDAKIENSFKWQKNHFNSIKTAYQSSPYFEFYEDDIAPFYEEPQKYLLDFLLKTQELTLEMLQTDMQIGHTNEYMDYAKDTDARSLANAKLKRIFPQIKYKQVFEIKHGFIPHLSILDLLFNEGPNALSLLKQ